MKKDTNAAGQAVPLDSLVQFLFGVVPCGVALALYIWLWTAAPATLVCNPESVEYVVVCLIAGEILATIIWLADW